MIGDWLKKLRSLRDLFRGKSRGETIPEPIKRLPHSDASRPPVDTVVVPPSAGQAAKETVSINLGIDFGTSFTKVCFRDVGTEESCVIPFGKPTLESALIPTIVAIDRVGRLYTGDELLPDVSVTRVPYLKMRLAGQWLGKHLGTVNGIDLTGSEVTRALSSWFLVAILKRSQDWIASNERSRLKNRTPVWSANVGVPVEYYDSDAIKVFREVLGVAWLWLKSGSIPKTLSEALAAYERTVPGVHDQAIDFHAVPEIAAAVHSFVFSRESVPGIYVYFDIGGGTLDGVAFDLVNMFGERRINFYSGKVQPLGITAFVQEVGGITHDGASIDLVEQVLRKADRAAVEKFAHRIRQLVANVVMTAKRKDGRDWQRDAFQGELFGRKFIGALPPSRMVPLVVFLGGGGAKCTWYRSAIASTYEKFKHDSAGIPPYKLLEVPKPADLSMRGLPDAEFGRFAISYGLSIPFGEGPDVGLPSQFGVPEPPRPRTIRGAVDYADSRDVYD